MGQRGLAWLVSLPLAASGTLLAHVLAYRLAVPDDHARAALLAGSGHGYLSAPGALLAALLGLALGGLAVRAALAARSGAGGRRPAVWPFALLAPLAFTVQEHVERLLHDGTFPIDALAEPTFLLGLALQAPLGLAAYLIARALCAGATRAGLALARRVGPAARILQTALPKPPSASAPWKGLAAGSSRGRAPPRAVALA